MLLTSLFLSSWLLLLSSMTSWAELSASWSLSIAALCLASSSFNFFSIAWSSFTLDSIRFTLASVSRDLNNTKLHRGEAMLRKHLHRRLRTFEENQISKIIRRTKCKKTLLKFHQFYRAKNTRRDTHKSRKPFFHNWKQQKTHLSQPETLKIKQK